VISREGASGDKTHAIYAQRFPEEDEAHAEWRRALWRVLVGDFFSRWIPETATVLDFGCGHGEFINAVRARRRIGIDIRAEVRDRLAAGVEFQLARETDIPGLDDGAADVIFCSNLLEHLRDRETVTQLLREFARILAPRGRLLVLGPNLRYTGAAYWDFFDHVLPFTHLTLVEALATADLRAETLIPRFLPYTTVGARRTPLALVRLYLRLPIAWRFLGAQFFAVAEHAAKVQPA
jgi:SAM-dependent methyltransferase